MEKSMADEQSPALAAVESATEASSAAVVETVSDAPQGAEAAVTPTAESAEPVSEGGEAEGQPTKGKSRAQERIEDLASTNRILREHNEWLREQVAARIKAPEAAAAPAPAAAEPPKPAPKPTLESCGWDTEVYERELDAWYDKKVDTGVDNALAKRREAKEQADLGQQALTSAAEFRKENKDFDLIVGNPKLIWSPTVVETLKASGLESAPLAFHLATNPDKLAKISKMRPEAARLALGRVLGEIAAAPKTTPAPKPASTPAAPAKKSTNAPPPPTPVETTTTSAEIDPVLGPKDPKEWKKWRQQQIAEKKKSSRVVNY